MKQDAERVIFRIEKNPWVPQIRCTQQKKEDAWEHTLMPGGGYSYLAVFPDEPANPGRLNCLPFFFNGDGSAVFEPFCEIDYSVYLKTRIVHAKDERAPFLLKAIEGYCDSPFRTVEKVTNRW